MKLNRVTARLLFSADFKAAIPPSKGQSGNRKYPARSNTGREYRMPRSLIQLTTGEWCKMSGIWPQYSGGIYTQGVIYSYIRLSVRFHLSVGPLYDSSI